MSAARRKAGWSRLAAIAAAYLLVLQAVFGGLASGAHAASMSLDRSLGMTLCAPGEMPPTDGRAAAHEMPSCCMLGCFLSGSGAPAGAAGFSPITHRPVDLIAFQLRRDLPHGFAAGRSPANPRAPPAAA